MTSPTQRTLTHLRKHGWTAAVVEKWIPQTKRRLDLFGGIDVVGIRPGETIGVQSTTAANQAARLTKLKAEPRIRCWLEAGNQLVVHGWSKRGAKGKRKLWDVTVTALTLADFESAELCTVKT